MGYRRTTDGGSEYNGLYVPPASESDYGYLSPPVRPPLPYLNGIHRFRGDDSLRDGISPNVINVYPEDEGHLVWLEYQIISRYNRKKMVSKLIENNVWLCSFIYFFS